MSLYTFITVQLIESDTKHGVKFLHTFCHGWHV